mmetsp:Transcript_706/g.781  ORF Transcript_706/g.781 Transcript_706/m.781 type:complete len:102 (+) Transcript_706:35-340(+)
MQAEEIQATIRLAGNDYNVAFNPKDSFEEIIKLVNDLKGWPEDKISFHYENLDDRSLVPIKAKRADGSYYRFEEIYLMGKGAGWRDKDPAVINVNYIYLGA